MHLGVKEKSVLNIELSNAPWDDGSLSACAPLHFLIVQWQRMSKIGNSTLIRDMNILTTIYRLYFLSNEVARSSQW